MKHIKLYEDFGADMFKAAHGAIDPDDLIPMKDLIGKATDSKGIIPTQKQFDEVVKFLDADPEYFYVNPKNFLEPVVYWKGPFYHGFFGGLNMESLKMMQVDKRFEMKKRDFEKYFKDNDYDQLFSRTDKKILIPTFIKMYDDIPDDQKYQIFVDLYQRSEYGFSTFPPEIIENLFPHRKKSSEWRKRMRELKGDMKLNQDGTVTVYRGENHESADEDHAFSWTLKPETAEFFANRFNKGAGDVLSKDINPTEIIDYLTSRGEAEVIVVPPALESKIKS